jgi:hypothetical protein
MVFLKSLYMRRSTEHHDTGLFEFGDCDSACNILVLGEKGSAAKGTLVRQVYIIQLESSEMKGTCRSDCYGLPVRA